MRLKQIAIRFALGVAAIGFSNVMFNCNYNTQASVETFLTESGLEYYVSYEGQAVIINYNGSSSEVVIPSKIGDSVVTTIDDFAFQNSNITKITIPDTVISIGDNAFFGCDNLTIYASAGSSANIYANNEGITFKDNKHSWVNVSVTPATKTSKGQIKYKCNNMISESVVCDGEKTETITKYGKITLSANKYSYTGKPIMPAVTVKDAAGKTIEKAYYTVSYSNNTSAGNATVTILFKNRYSGKETINFTITPTVTAITAPSIADDGITVKWTKNTTGNGYEIYRSVNGASYTKVKTISGNSVVSWKDKTATVNGAEYRYKIITTKTINNIVYKSGYSAIKTTYFLTKPSLTLTNTASNVKLTWVKNSKASGYYIYKSTDSGKTYKKYKTITSNNTVSYSDPYAKTNGIKYMYKIVSYKTVGGSTYKSVESSAKTYYYVKAPTISVDIVANGMKLSWTPNSNATGYYIYRSTDGTNYTKLKTITNSSTINYTDTTANTNGVKYYYKIKTFKTVNGTKFNSVFSSSKYRYFISVPTLSLSNTGSSVILSWSKNTKATGYNIYKSADGGKTYKLYKKIGSNSIVNYSDPYAKTNGSKYSYKIRAYKTVNNTDFASAYSGIKSYYFLKKPEVKLSNTADGITIEWSKNTKASGYYIYRSTDGKNFSNIKTITNKDAVKYYDNSANTNCKMYYYRVVAYKTVGSSRFKSANSTNKRYVHIKKTSVNVSNVSAGAKVTWSKNLNATGYYLYRSTDGKKYSKIKTITGGNNASYIDKVSGSSQKYLYKVVVFKTVNGVNFVSADSNIKALQMLTKPTLSRFTNVPGNKLVVRWDKNKEASGYEVNYSLDKSFNGGTTITIKDNTKYSYLIQNVSVGKVYYVRVRSYSLIGDTKVYSGWSAAKSVTAKATSNSGYSSINIGDTYVDLDLGKQHVYVYKNGKLVQDMDCVSGCTGWGMGTPAGLYKIGTLERNATLVGANYVTVVAYWIPFIGNGIGFHDASWKSKFGGEIYKTDGSHGCINLSTANAKTMYGLAFKGMPVIAYY